MKKDTSIWLILFFFLIFVFKFIILIFTFTWKYSITNEFQTLWFDTVLIMLLKFLQNDFFVFGTFFLLLYIVKSIKKSYKRKSLQLILILLIVYYLFDSLLIYFSTRLFVIDIPKFVFDIPDKRILFYWLGFFTLIGIIYFSCSRIKFFIRNIFLLYSSILFMILSLLPLHLSANYIKEALFSKNIYQLNLDMWYMKKYSNRKELFDKYNWRVFVDNWYWNRKNIILLVVESFSAVDSNRISWLKNYMPLLDKVMENWKIFTNFFASSNTTDGWLINLLQWVEVIPYRASSDYYSTFFPLTLSLPFFFNNLWYSTYFITTWPLEFLHKKDFLKNIWFDRIIWWDYFYDKPKYTFWSAPDEDLYEKSLSIIKENVNNWKPFFMNMLTISSHLTYNTPYWTTKEDMYRYVDEKIYDFYNKLSETWYFKNWILIIVWDHRKMSPLEDWEYEKYWVSSYWRIWASIIWTWVFSGIKDENIYQQTDLFYSLKKYFGSWDVDMISDYNYLFSWTIKRDFAIIPMFSDRNNVIVVKWNQSSIIKLDWDKTKYIQWDLWTWVLDYLNMIRWFQMQERLIMND